MLTLQAEHHTELIIGSACIIDDFWCLHDETSAVSKRETIVDGVKPK